MNEIEWFNYWNNQLWEAVKTEDRESEDQAIACLYCKPITVDEIQR